MSSRVSQLLLAVGGFAAATIIGCGGPQDGSSGGDHVRGKAVEIKLNTTHDDSISADDGDHTDWKSFALGGTTSLTINAYWDDPSVDAIITVRDQFGGRVFELKHKSGEPENHWRGIKLREGTFFLEVVASRGASVYTLELTAKGTVSDVDGSDSIAPPE